MRNSDEMTIGMMHPTLHQTLRLLSGPYFEVLENHCFSCKSNAICMCSMSIGLIFLTYSWHRLTLRTSKSVTHGWSAIHTCIRQWISCRFIRTKYNPITLETLYLWTMKKYFYLISKPIKVPRMIKLTPG